MRTYYSCNITDPGTGFTLVPDFEVELELDAEFDEVCGVTFDVTAVWVWAEDTDERFRRMKAGQDWIQCGEWVDMLTSRSTLNKLIAGEIIEQAQNDEALREQIMEREGVYYHSPHFSTSDPDGHYRQVSA